MAHVVVIGAGVIGLQTALTLLEDGYKVSVVAKHLPGDESGEYCSPWAGAVSRTHATGAQTELCEWDVLSYETWMKSIKEEPEKAEKMGVEGSRICVYSSQPADEIDLSDPKWWFASHVSNFRSIVPDQLPPGPKSGFSWDGVAINPPEYMSYLLSRIKSLGAEIIRTALPTDAGFAHAISTAVQLVSKEVDAVVNCSGLGAASLVPDKTMFPLRGQTLLVKFKAATPEPKISLYEDAENNVAYAFPRPGMDIWVFGGTKTKGDWSTVPDEEVSRGILERCCTLLGVEREGVEVLKVQVGLRPGREGGVRVEVEEVNVGDGVEKVRVVHQYGHSGAGYQNSMGSAKKVLGLLRESVA